MGKITVMIKKHKNIIYGFVILTIIFAAFIICVNYVMNRLGIDLCENEIIDIVTSPDGKYVAYIFSREAGATTKTSFQLFVTETKKEVTFNNSLVGNIYISYGSFGVVWLDNNRLLIKQSYNSDIFKQKKKYKNIIIEYE